MCAWVCVFVWMSPSGGKESFNFMTNYCQGKEVNREIQNVEVKMNCLNGNLSWAAMGKLYWTALVSNMGVCVFVCENVPTGSKGSLHLWFDLFCKSLPFNLNHPNALLSGSISCLSWYRSLFFSEWMCSSSLTSWRHHFPYFSVFSGCFPSPVWDSCEAILCVRVQKTIPCRPHPIDEPKQKL